MGAEQKFVPSIKKTKATEGISEGERYLGGTILSFQRSTFEQRQNKIFLLQEHLAISQDFDG